MNSSLEIAIELFIGIQIRLVRWQIKDLDFIFVVTEPVPDLIRMMYPQII